MSEPWPQRWVGGGYPASGTDAPAPASPDGSEESSPEARAGWSADPGEESDLTTAEPEAAPNPQVAEALVALHRLDAVPLAEHVAVYDDVHRRLQDALATLDGG